MLSELKNSNLIVADGERTIQSYILEHSCDMSIVIGNNADVVFCLLFCGEHDEKVTCNTKISIGSGSMLRFLSIDVIAGSSYIDYKVDLCGKKASFEFNGLYISDNNERKDVELDVMHSVSDCYSSESMKGIANGSGIGRFHGRIYVAPDAQRTEAYQQSRNLLLSDNARIFTEPQLEIYADDVKCSHGAVVGQIDNNEIYYMRQRGIDESEARKLLTEGFVKDILWHCGDDEFRNVLQNAIDYKLSAV